MPVGLAALALAPRVLRESRGERDALDLARPARSPPPASPRSSTRLSERHWWLARRGRCPLALLGSPPTAARVAGAVLTAALLTAATSGGAVLATLHLQDDLHLDPLQAGLHLLPLSVAVVIGSAVAARARSRSALGLGAGRRSAPRSHRSSLTAWALLAGFGLGSASVAATSLGMKHAEEPGTVAGLLSTAAQVGTAIGVATLVGLPDHGFIARRGGYGSGRRTCSMDSARRPAPARISTALSHGSSSEGS